MTALQGRVRSGRGAQDRTGQEAFRWYLAKSLSLLPQPCFFCCLPAHLPESTTHSSARIPSAQVRVGAAVTLCEAERKIFL